MTLSFVRTNNNTEINTSCDPSTANVSERTLQDALISLNVFFSVTFVHEV